MGKINSDFIKIERVFIDNISNRIQYLRDVMVSTKKIIHEADQDDITLSNVYANVNICEQELNDIMQIIKDRNQ